MAEMQQWAAAFAYLQGGGPRELIEPPKPEPVEPPPRIDTRRCYKCGELGHLAGRCPRGGPYVPAEESPWYVPPRPTKEDVKAAQAAQPVLRFGVHGDSLMQTRYEGNNKSGKKYRNFKADFENTFYQAFGECDVHYSIDGFWVKDIVKSINENPPYDILCVGITCNECFLPYDQQPKGPNAKSAIYDAYPEHFDAELKALAQVMLAKSKGSLVLCGGPAELWEYPARWDGFVERAANTLRRAGVQVVPRDTATAVMLQMGLSEDGVHFANVDHFKEIFAKAWAQWLSVAAHDISFGRVLTDESVRESLSENMTDGVQQAVMAQMGMSSGAGRERSRSRERGGAAWDRQSQASATAQQLAAQAAALAAASSGYSMG